MTILTIVGARPQFVKASAVSRALQAAGLDESLVHTGQHYDIAMDRVFFDELGLPEPAINLGVGSGSHAHQTAAMMTQLEDHILGLDERPGAVLIYGDTNSTLAAALVAAKLHVPVAHVEAGLRSFNRAMPEEVNRIVADSLSGRLYAPSPAAMEHLEAEGHAARTIFVGDVMHDVLLHYRPLAAERAPLATLTGLAPGFRLATLHRASTTDDPARFQRALDLLGGLGAPVVWPVHPRAQARLDAFGLQLPPNVEPLEPVGYLAMLTLLDACSAVLTDSGGLQKEAFWMNRPCVTLRSETEWVETLEGGWNHIVGLDADAAREALASPPAAPRGTPYGAGDAASRIAQDLAAWTG